MNKKSVLLILLCFLLPTVHAQDTQTSIFWKITGNGLSRPSYLYGSVHMIAQSDFFLLDSLEDIFKSCNEIVLEIDMDDPGMIQKVQGAMFMPDSSLSQLLDSSDYNSLQKFFLDSLGMPLVQLQRVKPLFLMQFMIPKMIDEAPASYELKFVEMAKKYNIELTGIETVEEQMNSLDEIPYKKQAEMVLETVKDFNKSREVYKNLISAYKKMDFRNLYKLLFESSPEFKDYERVLLIDRNTKWLPRIENKIKNKSCFIAVGALHLEGENGLVNLLRMKGYTLVPIAKGI